MRRADRPANRAARSVWLTFDDGPHPEHTPRVLDALGAHEVHATFFVVGRNVERHGTGLLQRARDEGHCIGNHSYSHPRLTRLSPDEVRDEVTRTDALISEFAGDPKVFRPPYGDRNAEVRRIVEGLGYAWILWNVDPRDWDRANQPDLWVAKAVDQVRELDHAVVLCHDSIATTADHVNLLLRQLKGLGGVRFEPCSTLATEGADPLPR